MEDCVINVALLKEVKEAILAAPAAMTDMSEWRGQGRCGTVLCVAGWTCQQAGGTWITSNPDFWGAMYYLKPEPADDLRDIRLIDLGSTRRRGVHAEARAIRLLGLTNRQAEDLFHYDPDPGGLLEPGDPLYFERVIEHIDSFIEEAESS